MTRLTIRSEDTCKRDLLACSPIIVHLYSFCLLVKDVASPSLDSSQMKWNTEEMKMTKISFPSPVAAKCFVICNSRGHTPANKIHTLMLLVGHFSLLFPDLSRFGPDDTIQKFIWYVLRKV